MLVIDDVCGCARPGYALGVAEARDGSRSVLERARDRLGGALERVDRVGEKLREAVGSFSGAEHRAAPSTAPGRPVSSSSTAREPSSAFGDPARAVQVFGRRSCFWSGQAVRLAERARLDLSYVEIGGFEGAAVFQRLKAETGQSTVPFVFVRGRFVGGFDDLERLHLRGELDEMAAPKP